MNGCPTALSAPETALLQRYASGRRVVEAGALLGYSTIQLARVAARRVVSIDRHSGYSGDTLARYMSNLDRAGIAHRVQAVVGEALEILPAVDADLAFIDLTGQRELTMAAMRATRAPLVAVHDYGRASCAGVGAAVRELRWRVVDRADTLIVCEAQ